MRLFFNPYLDPRRDTAPDESDNPREIYHCQDPEEDRRCLICTGNGNNVSIFDYENENFPWVDFSNLTDEMSLCMFLEGEKSRIVYSPPGWRRKGVGAQANAIEVVEFLVPFFKKSGYTQPTSYNLLLNVDRGNAWASSFGRSKNFILLFQNIDQNTAFSTSQTIVAHEILHTFIKLNNAPQDGERDCEASALTESYCDIFAVLFSNRLSNSIADWDWEIGHEISGFDYRDLSLDTYNDVTLNMNTYDRDNSSIIHNSLIHSHAAYLILNTRDNNENLLLDAKTGIKLFIEALLFKGFRKISFTFKQSRFALSEVAVPNVFPRDKAKQRLLQNQIARIFDDIGVA